MSRIFTLIKRILLQFRNDKRTVAFAIIAPILILGLVYSVTNSDTEYTLGIIKAPNDLEAELAKQCEDEGITIKHISKDSVDALKNEKNNMVAVIIGDDIHNLTIQIDGSDVMASNKMKAVISKSIAEVSKEQIKSSIKDSKDKISDLIQGISKEFNVPINIDDIPKSEDFTDINIKYDYVYGEENGNPFDSFGYGIIGIIIFTFVYLLGGINFLGERLSGTMDKMLTTPIRRHEIVLGYLGSYGLLSIIQTVVITAFLVYVLDVRMVGSVGLVMLINLLTAFVALSLGFLLSTISKSEFQLMQTVPITITPQVFLCGLFGMSGIWETISYIMPLRYTVLSLKSVMLKGAGFNDIKYNLLVLFLFLCIFAVLNNVLLKRKRKV